MRVISKLADVDFQFGEIQRDGNLLAIDSHPESKMQSRVYISPQDVVEFLKRFLTSPGAILFALGFPYFFYRWHKSGKRMTRARRNARDWPTV